MKLGYPCLNYSLDCCANRTFRIKSYSEKRLIETVDNNLNSLDRILDFNIKKGILFFRITSDLVPFASHPICRFDWQKHFSEMFITIGRKIRNGGLRVSMHPDQFTLINSLDLGIFERSVRELEYHSEVLDLMEIDYTHKIQIHVGGAYGDKSAAISRFIERYETLPARIKNRLVVENDDRIFNLSHCLSINKATGISVVFDVYHHELNSNGDSTRGALKKALLTWRKKDGMPIVDFSHADKGQRFGKHAESLNAKIFSDFLKEAKGLDFDIMFEIKDKESSALKALKILEKK